MPNSPVGHALVGIDGGTHGTLGVIEPRLRRSQRDPHDSGRHREWQVQVVAQDQDGTLGTGEPIEGPIELISNRNDILTIMGDWR